MNQPTDRDLQDRFAALRREDAAGALPFDTLRTRAARAGKPGLSWPAWTAAAAFLAILAVTAIAVLRHRTERQPLVSLATTRWQSPTDFLLRVPGAEYLETVPRLTLSIPSLADWRNP